MEECPWVAVSAVCGMYGLAYSSAKNRIGAKTFPVPVYKVGKEWVIDREVHAAYFMRKRAEGLQALQSTNGTQVTTAE